MCKKLDKAVYNYLITDDINPSSKGFMYLIESVRTIYDTGLIHHAYLITKDVYPVVAKIHNTTTSCVEKTIRYAIKSAGLDKTNNEYIHEIIYYLTLFTTL